MCHSGKRMPVDAISITYLDGIIKARTYLAVGWEQSGKIAALGKQVCQHCFYAISMREKI
jgi:hypothetical protein